MEAEYKFVLDMKVNDVANNNIVHSVSIMAVSIFWTKAGSVKTDRHYSPYICYITII